MCKVLLFPIVYYVWEGDAFLLPKQLLRAAVLSPNAMTL